MSNILDAKGLNVRTIGLWRQVPNGQRQKPTAIPEQADAQVAPVTQQAAHRIGIVVVVYMKPAAFGGSFSADSTASGLGSQEALVLSFGEIVSSPKTFSALKLPVALWVSQPPQLCSGASSYHNWGGRGESNPPFRGSQPRFLAVE